MKHANPTIETDQKGKSNMLILLLIGLVGIAGLVYVLNSSGGKASFSENEAMASPTITMVE